MMKLDNIAKSVAAVLLVSASSVVMAETVTVDATVTVNNAINFQHTGTLDFGILRATADTTADTCAILNLSAIPAAPTLTAVASGTGTLCDAGAGTAVIQSVGGVPARPEFTVSGVAAFTNLTLTLPTGTEELSATGLPAGAATFSIGNFTAYRTSGITPGVITTTLSTDNNGNAAFRVGAEIATHVAALTGLNYQDTQPYAGTFDVTVSY